MSQPPNAVLNGPSSEHNVPFKDAQQTQEMTKTHQSDGSPQQLVGPPRPPLTRLDSRSSLPLRPGFPSQPGVPPRPPQVRQPLPGQQQFAQRAPGTAPRPPGQPSFIQNQGVRPPVNPNFRPSTPFPRPQLPQGQVPRQPGIFPQRPVPTFRPQFEGEQFLRNQTLDSTDLTTKPPENVKIGHEDSGRSSVNAMKSRSYSVSSNVSDTQSVNDEERRRSVSSIGSVEDKNDKKYIMGSSENLDKKSDEYPSRPESRASSRMNKIMEDEDKRVVSSPSPQADASQKSVEFKLPTEEVKNKSPSPINKIVDKKEIKEDVKVTKPKDDLAKPVQNGITEKPDEKKPEPKHLELKNLKKAKSPSRSEGDNDSGVDESTQGNDQSSNGDQSSPRKSSGKNRTASTTPTKNRSLSRGSKSPSLKSPDSTASTPGIPEKKRVPMNKVQVGSAPSPNLKVVRSKIGSLENASYKPGGGHVKIENKKIDFKNASSRIEAKNQAYTPKGGDKKIPQQKLQWNAKSKVGSLENATHKPKGGEKKIESVKLDFKEKAKSKVGSKDNIKHVPGGGDIKFEEVEEEIIEEIENKKLDVKGQSKVGSMDNVKHKPGGGDKKIFDDKDYLKQRSAISSENHSLSGSQNSLPSQPEAGGPVADENLNQER